MKLSHEDKSKLLRRLPELKLSYENLHKKVSSDMYVLIPKGKKYIVWFTYFEDKKICVFIEVIPGTQKNIRDLFIIPQMFEKKIVLGTIFYGTLFSIESRKYLSIENIHYYKGKILENITEKQKLVLINNILNTEIRSSIITNNGIAMGLPIITTNFQQAISACKNLPYKIYSIQNRNNNSTSRTYNITLYKEVDVNDIIIIFAVKPNIQTDIYDLYYKNKLGELEKYDIASIPDFKTSKMMNSLFRNIKENDNLDALEESDDEDDFENMNDDKYVNLDKCVHMECMFNKRTNKYIPVKVNENGFVISKNDLIKNN